MELPARIGKYELEEFLGGGMSHVFRARDTLIGRTVAVKILTTQGCADEEVKARFLAEARMAGNLAHDNILSIYDFGEDEQQRPFMVMEFLRGEDLRNAIRNGNTGDSFNKIRIALQVARALEYTHAQGVVHRDIKPENVHINTAGVVKLIDFGIAKTEGLAMTRAGYVLGTPFYMAPEQVMGSGATGQVDVYAFGILLFELFTGAKPIQAETVERIFYFILNEPLDLEPLRQAGAPQAICDLVERCTQKKPELRPPGFGPIVEELERAVANRDAITMAMPTIPMAAPPPVAAPTPPSKRPAWLIPWVLLGVAAAGGALYVATRPHARQAVAPPVSAPAAPAAVVPEGMVLVPAGEFLFGKDKRPATLPAYYIDRTEVSNAAYAKFAAATGRAAPTGKPEFPVVNITIQDARDYAAWAQKKLPTSQQWEKAARGTAGLLYPWGDKPDASRANLLSRGAQPVTSFPNGESPFGVLNMVGNVWEFIDEPRVPTADTLRNFEKVLNYHASPTGQWFAARGLSFAERLSPDVLWDEALNPAEWKSRSLGFRCVKDAP